MAKRTLSAREKQWRTEDDARTITRYEEIKNDDERMKLATKHLQDEADKVNEALVSLKANGIMNNIIRGKKNGDSE